MKRLGFGVLAVFLLASLALAAGPTIQRTRWAFLGGLSIGNDTTKNQLDNTVTADVDFDFASGTIICTDTPATPAVGAKLGDTCFVGIGPRDGGVQIVTANSTFHAFVDAVDTVKLRHCPVGTAANPVDAGYVVRCLSSP